MTRKSFWLLSVLVIWCASAASVSGAASGPETISPELISGDRVLIGTVVDVRGEQARVHTGQLTLRFIPMGVRHDKGLEKLKKGDQVEITVNDQNLLVDVHLLGEASHHRVVQGTLAQPLVVGHDRAVLRTNLGEEQSHFIRPVARSKMASIPVGANVTFLIDEMDRVVDVTFGSMEAVQHAAELWQKKSPLKGSFDSVTGVIHQPLSGDRIVIRTEGGKEQSYDVRSSSHRRLAGLSKDDAVILFVDDESKVTDVAIPPKASDGWAR